ncbi:unnamed protein product [Adineta ricciae]|uniref:G-protein coupled receptors family 1 profile domain-containing protein n=1 Tax=Adineta ricciae TaxID=249248 RepID=A0A815VTU5_ADIRI|nr:unnamed protein product [Adineta ricciae]CAF1536484.1 unnamed protein product [Adineta ricciae]
MGNSTSVIITNLNTIGYWINQIFLPITIILGTFGNLFNIIIFTRPTLRKNPCALYFLCGSINNFFTLYVTILSRYLIVGWSINAASYNDLLCKLRNYAIVIFMNLTLWFVALASIDRYFASSPNARLRQLSSLSIARKIIIFTVVFTFLICLHFLIFLTASQQSYCQASSFGYAVFFQIFIVLTGSTIPIIVMAIFGILTVRNVSSIRNRITPQGDNVQNEPLRANERQMHKMLLMHLLVCLILTVPYGITSIYDPVIRYVFLRTPSAYDTAIYNVTLNITRAMYFTTTIIGFYVYTLTSPRFSSEFKRCCRYGLKIVLTTTKLIQCLPMRFQEIVLGENLMNTNSASMTASRGKRIILLQREQQQQTAVQTTGV